MASNQRLRKARKRVGELMEKLERWKPIKELHSEAQLKGRERRCGVLREQLQETLSDLARWEYRRRFIRWAKGLKRKLGVADEVR